jgi:superoxide reductase
MKFYKCAKCKKIILEINGSPCEMLQCCGEAMKLMKAGETDGAAEKHVPAVEVNGKNVKVCVGSVEHPMQEEHFIQFVALETTKGFQQKYLKPGEKPVAEFVLAEGEDFVAAYEYCNLHGLWKKE